MNYRYHILFSILVISLTSCYTPIAPDTNTNREQLVVDSEIVPGLPVSVYLSTTLSIFEVGSHELPSESNIEVSLSGEDGYFKRLRAKEGFPGVYINESPQIEEGKAYTLNASLVDDEGMDISAETTVPSTTTINAVEISDQETFQNPDGTYSLALVAKIAIDKPQDSSTYLHLIPQKVNEVDPGPGNPRTYSDLSRGNIELLNSFNAAKELEHKNGIFIDYNKISSDAIDLRITFNIGNLEDKPDHIKFALRTTSEEYYDYHENLSRQLTIGSLLVSDPIVEFTNIENGWGIFGSYSVSEFQVSL